MDPDKAPDRVNDLDEDGRPPLVAAAYQDNLELMEALLRDGADINAKSRSGKSALFTAVVYGKPDTARLLISNGADLTEKDEILIAAAGSRSDLESIRLMLEVGANPNYEKHPIPSATGDSSWTPLQQAAAFGTLDTVKLLVESGADVASTPHALVSAVVRGRIETAGYLIDRGADPNTRDGEGNPLLFVALEAPTAMLTDSQAAETDPWDLQLRLIRMLMDKGADLNLKNQTGVTLLQVAERDDNRGLVRLLRKRSSPAARFVRWLRRRMSAR